MLAAEQGHTEILTALLAGGAAVDVRNALGNSALIFAVQRGRAAAVKVLLDAGADSGLRNKKRETALSLARNSGNKDLLDLIEQYRAQHSKTFGIFR
jgi:ankyrin repeat protein